MDNCWLCRYNTHPDAKLAQSYMMEHASTVCPDAMAHSVARDLAEHHADAEGIDVATVLDHLRSHTLSPVLRMANMLRALVKLSDDMGGTLVTHDEDGRPIHDVKTIETYLKVQAQIRAIYNLPDANRMMFAEKSSI